MKKALVFSLLISVFSVAQAAGTPKTDSAVIHFEGRVVETQCALELGSDDSSIELGKDRELVPVDLTFHRCDEEIKPRIHIIPDKTTAKDNAFHTNTDAIVSLFKDGNGRNPVCVHEDLLCGAKHQTNSETDHTYRAMWVKMDQGAKGDKVQSAVSMEIEFD